jgi:hypothetical protein
VVVVNPAVPVLINFDDIAAPCFFVSTSPAREEYAAQGVHFNGDGSNGGSILDECGVFAVTGHSPPNFLAFNPSSALGLTPQVITFDFPISSFEINAGAGIGETITVTGYDAGGNAVDSQGGPLVSQLSTFAISGAGMGRVVITSPNLSHFVLDDMVFVK